MTDVMTTFRDYLPLPLRSLSWRLHPLDGELLLFERDNGLNVLLEGEETQHLQRAAPRTLLIAVTNACNLACPFCYRDLASPSLWRYDSLLKFCQDADTWGVLEVAFGGGEPMVFPHWQDFITELYETTHLAVNFTTNGTLLTHDFLQATQGKYGQIRVSLYEDNHWPETIALLTRSQARFGVNWLITPAELPDMENKFKRLLALGVRDFLLLSYKGGDPRLHLIGAEYQQLATELQRMYRQFGSLVQMKLDVCWGNSLPDVPRLFIRDDCGAGNDFLSITSDKHVKMCSFQQSSAGIPFDTLANVRTIWDLQRKLRTAAQIGGCARLPQRGLAEKGAFSASIDLAAIQ